MIRAGGTDIVVAASIAGGVTAVTLVFGGVVAGCGALVYAGDVAATF